MAHLLYSADGIGNHELVGSGISNGYAKVSATGKKKGPFGIMKPILRARSKTTSMKTKRKSKPKLTAQGRKPKRNTKKTTKKPKVKRVRRASGFFDDLEQGLQTVGRIVDPIANIAQKVIPVVSQIAPLIGAGPKRTVTQQEKDIKARIAYTKKRLRDSIALNKQVAQRGLMQSGLSAKDAMKNVNDSLRSATSEQLKHLKLTNELRLLQETLRIYEGVNGWVRGLEPVAI